jgi:hypothetical protein
MTIKDLKNLSKDSQVLVTILPEYLHEDVETKCLCFNAKTHPDRNGKFDKYVCFDELFEKCNKGIFNIDFPISLDNEYLCILVPELQDDYTGPGCFLPLECLTLLN